MVKSAEAWAKKQLDRVRVSQDAYREGVESVSVAPAKAALAANAKRIKKIQESIANKTWEKKMEKVTLEDWKSKTLALGTNHFIEGVEANIDKIEDFIRSFQPKLQTLQNQIKAMPDASESDRDNRALANIRGMRKLKGTW